MNKIDTPAGGTEAQAGEYFTPRAMSFFLGLSDPKIGYEIKEAEKKPDELYPSDIEALIEELKSIYGSDDGGLIYVPCLPTYEDLKREIIKKGLTIGLNIVRPRTGIKMHERTMDEVIAKLEEFKCLVAGYHSHTKFQERFSAIHDVLLALYAYTASQLPHEKVRHLDLSAKADVIKKLLLSTGTIHLGPSPDFEKAYAKDLIDDDVALYSNLAEQYSRYQLKGERVNKDSLFPEDALSRFYDWLMPSMPVKKNTLDPENSTKVGFRMRLAMYVNRTAWPDADKHLRQWLEALPDKDPAIDAPAKIVESEQQLTANSVETVLANEATVSVEESDTAISDQEFLEYEQDDYMPAEALRPTQSTEEPPAISMTVRYIDMENVFDQEAAPRLGARQWVVSGIPEINPDDEGVEETDASRLSYFNLEDINEQYANPCTNALMIFLRGAVKAGRVAKNNARQLRREIKAHLAQDMLDDEFLERVSVIAKQCQEALGRFPNADEIEAMLNYFLTKKIMIHLAQEDLRNAFGGEIPQKLVLPLGLGRRIAVLRQVIGRTDIREKTVKIFGGVSAREVKVFRGHTDEELLERVRQIGRSSSFYRQPKK